MALTVSTTSTSVELVGLLQRFREELGENAQKMLTTDERSTLATVVVELLETTDFLLYLRVMKDDPGPGKRYRASADTPLLPISPPKLLGA